MKQWKDILKDPVVVTKGFSWLMNHRKKQKNDPSPVLAMDMQANQHLTFLQLQTGVSVPQPFSPDRADTAAPKALIKPAQSCCSPGNSQGKHKAIMLPQPHPYMWANGPFLSLSGEAWTHCSAILKCSVSWMLIAITTVLEQISTS